MGVYVPKFLKNNFNPRSREGSDEDFQSLQGFLEISIHAPVKGATDDY